MNKNKYVLGIQGSPRRHGNTSELMNNMLQGAKDSGAVTEIVQLADLNFSSCKGCYNCQLNNENFGMCIVKDDMQDLYQKIEKADAVVFGSPVYFCAITAEMKSVIDRLFPYLTNRKLSGKKTAFIYTQNQQNPRLYDWHFDANGRCLTYLGFDYPEMVLSIDTFGEEIGRDINLSLKMQHARKQKHRDEVFPKDMEKAYLIGQSLIV